MQRGFLSNLQIVEKPAESKQFKTPFDFFQYNLNRAQFATVRKTAHHVLQAALRFVSGSGLSLSAAPFFFHKFTTKPQYQHIAPKTSPFQNSSEKLSVQDHNTHAPCWRDRVTSGSSGWIFEWALFLRSEFVCFCATRDGFILWTRHFVVVLRNAVLVAMAG